MEFKRTCYRYLIALVLCCAGTVIGAETGLAEQGQTDYLQLRPRLQKGIFLIASRGLKDPNFRQSVILLTEYNEQRTVGLIINRPLAVAAEKAFPQLGKLTADSGNLHLGGPVAMNDLQLLIQLNEKSDLSTPLFENIYLVNNAESFNHLLQKGIESSGARLYAGYAGWASGQLETELLRGDWYLWQADRQTVFKKSPESIWPELIALVSAQWANYNFRIFIVPNNSGLDV